MAVMCQSPHNKERRTLLKRGKGSWQGYSKQSAVEKMRVQSIVAFHWLSCDNLSLAEMLPSKEKIFLPPDGGSKVVSFPAGDVRSSSVRICIDIEL